MTRGIVAFAVLVCVAFSPCTSDRIHKFRRCRGKRYISSGILAEIPASNELQCSRLCAHNSTCLSANFMQQNDGSTCQFFADTGGEDCEGLSPDSSTVFIMLSQPRCINGGSWDVQSKQCIQCDRGFSGRFCQRHLVDCFEGKLLGYMGTENILIQPADSTDPFEVICLFDYGFTIAEQRGAIWKHICGLAEDFNRNWTDYKNGFGNFSCDYFIGLEKLHLLTNKRNKTLLVVAGKHQQNWEHAYYYNFTIADETHNYTLDYEEYRPDPIYPSADGFGLGAPSASVKTSPFCTPDRDCGSCAAESQSGWWFNSACSEINLHTHLFGNVTVSWPASATNITKVPLAAFHLFII